MSFYSYKNANPCCCPGTITNGSALDGLQEKVCVQVKRVYDSCLQQEQLDDKEVYYGKENIDLLSFAKEVCDRLEPMAQSRNVTVELSGDAVLYLASRQLMNDLFYNLIENGIKYNKPNGKLWVTVSEKKGHPCISVKDTGIGVPMKYQSRIFERFFRVDKSHSKQTGGTGLGLSIVKHVVEYYGGYIEIHSKMEEGTEIVVHL